MRIHTYNLATLESSKLEEYSTEIAAWFFNGWGKQAGRDTSSFKNEILNLIERRHAIYYIAVDEEHTQLVGTISLRQSNMEEEEQYVQFGPWLSGLYVKESYRKQKISVLLGFKAAEHALRDSSPLLYYFTHHLDLLDFYRKLEGQELKPFLGGSYQYKGKPILLFSTETNKMLIILKKYFKEAKIDYDEDNNVFDLPAVEEPDYALGIENL